MIAITILQFSTVPAHFCLLQREHNHKLEEWVFLVKVYVFSSKIVYAYNFSLYVYNFMFCASELFLFFDFIVKTTSLCLAYNFEKTIVFRYIKVAKSHTPYPIK